jgi:peptidoglycan/xylan/chitin deacetylase (PgdA/CDA1 family)
LALPNTKQVFALLVLIALASGLFGCRPGPLPAPPPTPAADSSEAKTLPVPTVISRPTAMVVPTPTSPSAAPLSGPGFVPSVAPGLPSIKPALITNGDRSRPYIALTFDACQTASRPAGYDETIIKILTETGTPATLFLGGLWVKWHPAQTQALASNPLFELGNHSWSHPNFAQLRPGEMSNEILWTQDIIYKLTGQRPKLFRFPFDDYTAEALAVVGRHGLHAVRWDVVTGDADPRISARAIVEVVTDRAQNGSIVIMHMNARGWHTAEALPAVIRRLHDKGYTFVTVSQLLGLAPLPARSSASG